MHACHVYIWFNMIEKSPVLNGANHFLMRFFYNISSNTNLSWFFNFPNDEEPLGYLLKVQIPGSISNLLNLYFDKHSRSFFGFFFNHQVGLHQTKSLLHSKGSNEKAACRMGENTCKPYIW